MLEIADMSKGRDYSNYIYLQISYVVAINIMGGVFILYYVTNYKYGNHICLKIKCIKEILEAVNWLVWMDILCKFLIVSFTCHYFLKFPIMNMNCCHNCKNKLFCYH